MYSVSFGPRMHDVAATAGAGAVTSEDGFFAGYPPRVSGTACLGILIIRLPVVPPGLPASLVPSRRRLMPFQQASRGHGSRPDRPSCPALGRTATTLPAGGRAHLCRAGLAPAAHRPLVAISFLTAPAAWPLVASPRIWHAATAVAGCHFSLATARLTASEAIMV